MLVIPGESGGQEFAGESGSEWRPMMAWTRGRGLEVAERTVTERACGEWKEDDTNGLYHVGANGA